MQKLKERNTYTPANASQVCGNCDLQLNRDQSLSAAGSKTSINNPDVNLPSSHTKGLKAMAYVLSIDGEVLMPCTRAKARKLLKSKRADCVKLYPFTIKLNFECENQVQDVTLGIDTGYQNVGFSCVNNKQELVSGTLILDCKTSRRLSERKMYRIKRRNNLWYRKPRFLNRKKNKGWLPPSIQRRYDAHLRLITLLKSILPISQVNIEIANFDIQKIEIPEISGIVYQYGETYGYQNARAYLMAREHGKCQLCHKEFNIGEPSHVHHCKQRSEHGSNRVKNMAILHKKCHEKLHNKGLKLNAPTQYKEPAFLSIINNKFKIDAPDANITFGYVTFINRNKLGLEKTHYNDAFVIAGGNMQERGLPIIIKQRHRNNRVLQINRNGFAPSIRKQHYAIQPNDLIWINNKKYIVRGIQNKGTHVLLANLKKVMRVIAINKIYHFGGFIYIN